MTRRNAERKGEGESPNLGFGVTGGDDADPSARRKANRRQSVLPGLPRPGQPHRVGAVRRDVDDGRVARRVALGPAALDVHPGHQHRGLL